MKTNEKTVVTAAGPEDMIATVWFNLGYKPRDSLVLLGLEGPRQRVGVLLRADLPDRRGGRSGAAIRPLDRLPPEQQRAMLPELVQDLLVTVAASGASGVMAIVADEQALDRRLPPVVRALRQGVREFGLRLVDVLAVTSTAFGSLMCRDRRCCPPGGRPIDRVLSSRTAAVHVVSGDTVAESEADLLADVTPGSLDPPPEAPSDPRARSLAEPEPRLLWWERWGNACAAAAKVPGQAEPLPGFSAALHDSYLRDAVLISLLGAAPDEVNAMLCGCDTGSAEQFFHSDAEHPGRRWLDADQLTRGLGRLLQRRPDDQRLSVGRTVLAGAARVAAEGDRGPALAVLAMLAWFEGRGGRSRLLIERARADGPPVSLCGLVEDLLVQRVAPPWLRNGPEG